MQIRSPSGTSPPRTGSIDFPTGNFFLRQRGLLDLHRGGDDDPTFLGDAVARLDKDHVARNELLDVDLRSPCRLDELGRSSSSSRPGLHARLGLREGLSRVPITALRVGGPRQQDRRAHVVRDERVDHGRREEDDLREVLVLAHEGVELADSFSPPASLFGPWERESLRRPAWPTTPTPVRRRARRATPTTSWHEG